MKHSLQRWLLLLSFGLALGARGQSPTLATIETSNALYTGQPVQLTNTLTVSSGTSLTGATVSISSGFQSATNCSLPTRAASRVVITPLRGC